MFKWLRRLAHPRQSLAIGLIALTPSIVQCEPPPPPLIQCAGNIEDLRNLPQSYTVICSSGEGWVTIELQCLTQDTNSPTWWVSVSGSAFRPNGYKHPNPGHWSMEDAFVYTVRCPSWAPYMWDEVTLVYTWR